MANKSVLFTCNEFNPTAIFKHPNNWDKLIFFQFKWSYCESGSRLGVFFSKQNLSGPIKYKYLGLNPTIQTLYWQFFKSHKHTALSELATSWRHRFGQGCENGLWGANIVRNSAALPLIKEWARAGVYTIHGYKFT